ncbi:MAG: TonB-dependent receptor [Opitutaceae bacterium]|nr:TonB-dependent receptor [Opitutaceae bacterium]
MNSTKNYSPARALRASARLFPSFASKATAAAFALIAVTAATPAPAARAQTAPAPTGTPATSTFTANTLAPINTLATNTPAANTLAAGTPADAALADDDATVQLEAYVVSASRTRQNIKLTPSSVTSLALSELNRIQISDLRTALQMTPGVNISETGGAAGSKSAIFMRGAGANQTLFLIDGIRMNAEDWTSGYTNYLGAAGLAGLERVEILRGPQSTLYGGAAMGGVVALETARGRGPATGVVAIDGGSLNSIGATAAVAGSASLASNFTSATQTLGYSAALTAACTENDRDFNTFRHYSGSTRIEYQLADRVTAGFTYRGLRSHYEEPGPAYDPTQAGLLDLNIDIATLYAAWKPVTTFDTCLTYGWIQNIYDWDSSYPSYAHSTRNVIDWQNTWQALEQLQLVGGINTEWSRYDSGDTAESERLVSIYINAVANPLKNLELTAGIRADDYSTFDAHATWRAGAAWRIEETKTTFRATYGTGFNAPAPQYVQGGGWYAANPDLKPEKSKGWDIGVEQDLWRDRITLGATFFKNDFENKFLATPNAYYLYQYHNIPDATTKGLETCLYARPLAGLNTQLTYTYLDTRDSTGARLIRQPRHILAADINYQFTKQLMAGAGLSWFGGRPDETYSIYDASWTPTTIVQKMPDYVIVRAYASYNVCKNLKLKLRLENLFDKKYDTVAGYPGLPLGIFGGVEWKF